MTLTEHALCPISGQPVYKGLPVPWIALWSAEFNPQRVMLAEVDPEHVSVGTARQFLAMFTTSTTGGTSLDELVLAYADCRYTALGAPADPLTINSNALAQRDEFGLLWHRDLPGQGRGEPRFAGLHAARQRDCMVNHRCQVCSAHFPDGEPVTFLHSKVGLVPERDGEPIVTGTAPTCERCIPLAMRACPVQRQKPRVIIRAQTVRPHEVLGDVYAPWGIEDIAVTVPFHDPRTLRMNCKQMMISVGDYTMEDIA